MSEIDPLSVDFASLRTLRMVHALGSFSRAADSLGVGQSTVSYTIDRLRRAFGDPLFVRQGTGVAATDRCTEIVIAAASMLDEFTALSEPKTFDPARANATVTLSCNYYERVVLIPALVRILRREAPLLKVNILSSTVHGKEQLSRGQSDLLIGPIKITEAGFYGRRLMSDHYVCVMDPANPLARAPLSAAAYVAAPHVVVTYGGNWRSSYLLEIERRGLALNPVMEVPSPANLSEILIGSDLISTVPSRTARAFGAGVTVMDCPFPAPFEIDLNWTSRTHHSLLQKWLRAKLAQVAGAGPAG